MKTQLSQWSDRPDKRYAGVYIQQGRMITDADWNEQVEHAKRALRATASDVVGNGVPRVGGVLGEPAPDNTASLEWGVAHVDGIRAAVVPVPDGASDGFEITDQADLLAATEPLRDGAGVYLDVWERTVVALQDEDLVDPALAGADTASRQQVLAQVKQCEVVDGELAITREGIPRVGNAELEATVREAVADPDPCDPCDDEIGVDLSVPNALFRLEVHDVDDPLAPSSVTLKWSMENGAEAFSQDPSPPAWFTAQGYVFEAFNTRTEQLAGLQLLPLGGEADAVELKTSFGVPDAPPGESWQGVRRWDGYCELARDDGGWTVGAALDRTDDLAAGEQRITVDGDRLTFPLRHLQLTLTLPTDGSLRLLRGDHWLVRVRDAAPGSTGGSDDPDDVRAEVVSATPIGIVHHYLPLGIVDGDRVRLGGDDGRRARSFPPLTDIRAGDVGYEPCTDGRLDDSHTTVQKALDALCSAVEEEPDDCAPRLALFGRGVVCGVIPSTGAARKQREVLAEALSEAAERLRHRSVFTFERDRRRIVLERRGEIAALIESDDDRDNREALTRIERITDAREAPQYAELADLLRGYESRRLADGQTVRFRTTPGKVVDGHGCYHDVGALTLTTRIDSFRLRGGAALLRRRLAALAEERRERPGRISDPQSIEVDLVERRERSIDALMAAAPETEEDAVAVLDELDFRTITLRDAVARTYLDVLESDRQPQRVTGWLYMVFPDGEPALEFRLDGPEPWGETPGLLARGHRLEVGATARKVERASHEVVAALTARVVAAAEEEEDGDPDTGGVAGGVGGVGGASAGLVEDARRLVASATTGDGAVNLTHVGRAFAREHELDVDEEELLAVIRDAATATGVSVVEARSREGEVLTFVAPTERPDPAATPPVFGVGDAEVLPLPEIIDPGDFEVELPDGVVKPPRDGLEGVDSAWAAYADAMCPQENDDAVCLGKVAAYGNRVVIVPDDREQLLATPANVNAMVVRHLRGPSSQLFDRVMAEISGGDT